VRSKSNGSQVPEERSSLEGDFYFAKGSIVVEETPAPSAVREPATGRLTVRSNVGDAKVYIDGVYEGDTPHTAILKPGAYSIILKKAGYSDAAEDVRVEAGSAKTISIVMEKPAPPPAEARTFTSPTLSATFALIPTGTFTMGSPTNEPGRNDNETQHRVMISQPFYMQTTEVTQWQWEQVMGNNPSYFKNCGTECPVEQVSWNDIQEFIRKLNRIEGTLKYRLPTEAEWEYAARAGTSRDSNDFLSQTVWDSSNSGSKTHPVGQKTPNAWGLYDMHGNVCEWVQDWYGDYSSGSVTDPEGPSSGTRRVLRGGAWGFGAGYRRSAFRLYDAPGTRSDILGFRLLRTR
jgi:formylglycine-generating enzyme required for sulfatase activity